MTEFNNRARMKSEAPDYYSDASRRGVGKDLWERVGDMYRAEREKPEEEDLTDDDTAPDAPKMEP